MFAEKDRLEARLDEIRPGLVSFVRNLPVLDLANPSLKINQVMPANLKDDVIFTQTEKVDRCTTCHLGIDKKGYEEAPQPFRTHPDMEFYVQGAHAPERLGCTSCHQGRGRATSFVKAAHTASSVEQEKAWGKYSGHERYETMHYWDWPMAAKGHTESQCAKCHQGVVEVPRASSLNTGRFLVERYGCHGCHKIKGWEDLRKVGPTLTRITGKTTEDWIYRWIKEPKGFRPTRMPQVWDVRPDETAEQKKRNDLEANAVAAYIVANAAAEPYPAPPSGDLGRDVSSWRTWAAWAATGWATTRAGSTSSWPPPTARTGPTSTARAPSSTRAGSTPGSATPRATGTTPGCPACGSRRRRRPTSPHTS
jgi:hypothetical protein